jgi:hypothetical protein
MKFCIDCVHHIPPRDGYAHRCGRPLTQQVRRAVTGEPEFPQLFCNYEREEEPDHNNRLRCGKMYAQWFVQKPAK